MQAVLRPVGQYLVSAARSGSVSLYFAFRAVDLRFLGLFMLDVSRPILRLTRNTGYPVNIRKFPLLDVVTHVDFCTRMGLFY